MAVIRTKKSEEHRLIIIEAEAELEGEWQMQWEREGKEGEAKGK
jgi:hypothetical protein